MEACLSVDAGREDQSRVAVRSPLAAHGCERQVRKNHIAILSSFAKSDMNPMLFSIDILNFKTQGLNQPEPHAVSCEKVALVAHLACGVQ